MSISLDIGTSRLRSLRRDGGALVGRGVPADFALVADDPIARELLGRSKVAFASGEGEIALVGDAALSHAATFRAVPLRLMPGGLVPTDDPPARQILGTLIESLLPESIESTEPCGLILSAASLANTASREFLSRLVWLRGYRPILISSSHAVALATLSQEGFTGLALSMGAGSCMLSLVHRGRELACVGEPCGTDWIDSRLAAGDRRYIHDAAGERYLDTEAARRHREAMSDPLTRPVDDFAARVAECYRDLLLGMAKELGSRMREERLGPFSSPLAVVCAGGGTRAGGFASLFSAALAAADLPMAVDPVRVAPLDDYLVARGGLIHADLEATCAAAA